MIREYQEPTGYAVGYKPAGGIRSAKNALEYLYLMKEELGHRWLKPTCSASAPARCSPTSSGSWSTSSPGATRRRTVIPWLSMTSVREIFDTHGVRTGAGGRCRRARVARQARCASSATSSPAGGRSRRRLFDVEQPGDRQAHRAGVAGLEEDVDAAVKAARKALPAWQALGGARARALPVRARARGAAQLAAARRAREHGQRQEHPRDARHRRAARRAALLSSRRLGAAARQRVRRLSRARASSDRSSRGTSRCSCWRGRSRPRSRRDARSSSSPPSSLRSPRCCSPSSPSGRAAAGCAQHRHRRRRHRAPPSSRTTASTRSRSPGRTEVGRIIRKATAGAGKKLSLELGGKSPFIVFDDADLDSRRRRRRRRDLVQPGPGLLRRLAAARAGRGQRAAHREAARAHGDAATRLAARQGGGHGRDRRAGAARAHPLARGSRGRRRRRDVAADVGVPAGGLLLPADAVHRTCSRRRRSRRWRSSGRCSSPMTFRTPSEAVALANNTPYGLAA